MTPLFFTLVCPSMIKPTVQRLPIELAAHAMIGINSVD